MVTGYSSALAVTFVVEAFVYGVGLPRLGPVGRREAVIAALLVNLVSHPVAWFVLWPLVPVLAVVEALVVAFEWAALARWRRFDRPLLFVLVLVANAASLLAGAVVA